MGTPAFDLSRLHRALDDERVRQGLGWAALGRRVGVAPSTLRRYATADDAEADGVLAAVRWLGTVPEDYLSGGPVAGTPLTPPGPGHVRVDMDSVAEADGDPAGSGGRTRTTIQRLAAAARGSGRSMASLTRLTEL